MKFDGVYRILSVLFNDENYKSYVLFNDENYKSYVLFNDENYKSYDKNTVDIVSRVVTQ
jgi:uncharacterized protein YrzB (UPF0473 family)